eukprot:CCRYP_004331-RA/>CCRYP_004331-RA protein AED:0.42 eAED:0.42 QI:0/1/0.66/1/0/0/3/108/100
MISRIPATDTAMTSIQCGDIAVATPNNGRGSSRDVQVRSTSAEGRGRGHVGEGSSAHCFSHSVSQQCIDAANGRWRASRIRKSYLTMWVYGWFTAHNNNI